MAAYALAGSFFLPNWALAATSGSVTYTNYIAIATHDANNNEVKIPETLKNSNAYRLCTVTVTDSSGNPVHKIVDKVEVK